MTWHHHRKTNGNATRQEITSQVKLRRLVSKASGTHHKSDTEARPIDRLFVVEIPLTVLQTCRHVHLPHSVLPFNLASPANPKVSTMVTPTHLCYLCIPYAQCKRFPLRILFTHCLIESILGNFAACTFLWSCSNIKSNILLADVS